MAEQDSPNYQEAASATFKWLVGWIIMLILLGALNTTRIGHVILYYSLALMIFVVLLTQAPRIAVYVGAISGTSPA